MNTLRVVARTFMAGAALALSGCEQSPDPVDDPGAFAACLDDSPGCAAGSVCGFRDAGVECHCRAGHTERDGGCAPACAPPPAWAPTSTLRFVGPNGETPAADCTGGTRQRPWSSVRDAQEGGCITPGTTVRILAGTYDASALFGGELRVVGTAQAPIWIGADRDDDDGYPVIVRGQIFVTAQHLVLDGLEVVQQDPDNGIMIGGQQVTVQRSFVHGSASEQDYAPGGGSDCVKILGSATSDGTETRTIGIRIIDNEIARCPEDAIDP